MAPETFIEFQQFLCVQVYLLLDLLKRILFFQDKHKIFMAKYYCVRLHSLFGAALAAGLVVARTTPKISIPRLAFS